MKKFFKLIKMLIYALIVISIFCWALLPGIMQDLSGAIVNAIKMNIPEKNNKQLNSLDHYNDARSKIREDVKINKGEIDSFAHDKPEAIEKGEATGSYFLTLDEVISMQNINLEDKIAGLAVLKKLGKSEMERIVELTNAGITNGEMHEIKAILTKRLSQEDLECLNEILIKNKKIYSQYKESKK